MIQRQVTKFFYVPKNIGELIFHDFPALFLHAVFKRECVRTPSGSFTFMLFLFGKASGALVPPFSHLPKIVKIFFEVLVLESAGG